MQKTVTVDEARKLGGLTKKEAELKRAKRKRQDKAAADARRANLRLSNEPVKVRLPFPPLLNTYYGTRAIVPRHGKAFASTYISTDGKAYRKAIIDLWPSVGVTFEGRLAIKVVAVFPDNRVRDLDGLWKSLLDSLEHAGAYENDSQIKAESMEQEAVESPGWVDIVLGPKPNRDSQKTLFDCDW